MSGSLTLSPDGVWGEVPRLQAPCACTRCSIARAEGAARLTESLAEALEEVEYHREAVDTLVREHGECRANALAEENADLRARVAAQARALAAWERRADRWWAARVRVIDDLRAGIAVWRERAQRAAESPCSEHTEQVRTLLARLAAQGAELERSAAATRTQRNNAREARRQRDRAVDRAANAEARLRAPRPLPAEASS